MESFIVSPGVEADGVGANGKRENHADREKNPSGDRDADPA
jgi:hypothetical protein